MFVSFDQLPAESRIWIYQSDTGIPADKKQKIENFLKSYCDEWKAHGRPLRSSFRIHLDRFVILAADEGFNSPSGCSIDDSVRAIKHITAETGLQFFNREMIAFFDGSDVFLLPLKNLKENYQQGIWNESTITFNNLVDTKAQLENRWMVPAGETWLKRFCATKVSKN